MKKGKSQLILLTLFVVASMLLAACDTGGAATPTAVAPTATTATAADATATTAAPAATNTAGTGTGTGETIKIVSSLPRTGLSKGQTDTIVNAFKMALEENDNKAGNFTIVYEDWDDATAAAGKWDPASEAANAN